MRKASLAMARPVHLVMMTCNFGIELGLGHQDSQIGKLVPQEEFSKTFCSLVAGRIKLGGGGVLNSVFDLLENTCKVH